MKKIVFLAWPILLLAQVVSAQEKVEAPVWNVGDKWTLTQGAVIEVTGVDQRTYRVRLPNETVFFDKSTLNRAFLLQGKKRETYKEGQRKLLNFPLTPGKNWKDSYSAQLQWGETYTSRVNTSSFGDEASFFESYKALGWEDVDVPAGSFKAIKIEYKREWSAPATGMREGKAWYWYSPEVKYLVKCQYDKSQIWSKYTDWELISFHVAN